ncbi:acetyltransferase [Opitutaceae bacterium TAV1]|nr:acetyltransferase [Opitutaceae bacterium TAV1]
MCADIQYGEYAGGRRGCRIRRPVGTSPVGLCGPFLRDKRHPEESLLRDRYERCGTTGEMAFRGKGHCFRSIFRVKGPMIHYTQGGVELLGRIEPLWLLLREHHVAVSPHFAAELAGTAFSDRASVFLKKKESGDLFVCIAEERNEGVGYVIASVEDNAGEIDSLFVLPRARKSGIGRELLNRTLDWLNSSGSDSVLLSVIFGNDEALNFYSRYGLYPRSLNLYRKEPGKQV